MCGIFGIINSSDAARNTYYGLYSLQHRGQEAAGIVTAFSDGQKSFMPRHKDFGLVTDVFKRQNVFDEVLNGDMALGHTRYSTSGASNNANNIQPFVVNYKMGNLAIAHNGNLSNATVLRDVLTSSGTIFQSTSDTELILHLIAQSRYSRQFDQIIDAIMQIEGAFSLILMTDDKLIATRDPHGFRPLSLGILEEDGKSPAYVLSSETCAFDLIGATFVRDIEPGEVLILDKENCATGNFQKTMLEPAPKAAQCVFEYIYFSRPDSKIYGEMVDKVRRKMGKQLAHEHPVPVDNSGKRTVVVAVPDSSNTATIGYVNENIKQGFDCRYEIGLIRNHYVGRTFIAPGQNARELKVRCKFNPVSGVLKDRIVVMVDDSIVRGTTCKQLVKMVRNAGAKEVHFRVASPPVISPCFYGMDFPSEEELLANKFEDIDEMAKWLGVDSLAYLSQEGMLEAVQVSNPSGREYCTACFSKNYPVPVYKKARKEQHEYSLQPYL